MRRSWVLSGIFICGAFFAAGGCQSAATSSAASGIPSSEKSNDTPANISNAFSSATPAILTPPPTPAPAFTSVRLTAEASAVTSTPTVCSAAGPLNVDGRPTPAPTLPASAAIQNIHGQEQSLPLDCESRSAVDWAGFFGVKINELEFFYKLPVSNDPNQGFVGNVRGSWGNLPPNAYGVYAGPVAQLLRGYGMNAHAYRGMSWDQLRAEVAAGRPAIVWVVGHVSRSTPVTLTVTGGGEILAAKYEHTVIFVGYDEKHAAVLDGSVRFAVPYDVFLTSWATLGNMAVVDQLLPARPDCAGSAVELVPENQ